MRRLLSRGKNKIIKLWKICGRNRKAFPFSVRYGIISAKRRSYLRIRRFLQRRRNQCASKTKRRHIAGIVSEKTARQAICDFAERCCVSRGGMRVKGRGGIPGAMHCLRHRMAGRLVRINVFRIGKNADEFLPISG